MTKPYYSARTTLVLVLLAVSLHAGAQQFQPEINAYLQSVQSRYALRDADIRNWTISDQYTDRETGVTHTYLHQQIAGIRIYNAVSAMAIRQSRVVYFANRFFPDAASKANSATPAVLPERAIEAAARQLGLSLSAAPVLQETNEARHLYVFSSGGIAREAIKTELLYVPYEGAFRLAWNVNLALRNSADWWNVRIDAQNGDFLGKNNWTLHCSFDAPHRHEASCLDTKTPAPKKVGENAGASAYNVFAFPLEAPSFGARSLLSDPHSTDASPFGWHDVDGAAGAEFTITRGNNVYAYEDRNNSNNPGYSPDGGANLQFDFPLNLNQDPIANEDAIITNLFYLNNIVHDVLYHHGFDEKAGNFQQNNYGNGGLGEDFVEAEAQDGGGTNNANFSTPDDGSSGRMQMYLWPSGSPALLNISFPADIAGDYLAIESGFGPDLNTPLTGDLILYEDATAPASDGCSAALNAAAISGKIVVIDRGTCPFTTKINNAEAAGAIAIIICNNVAGDPFSIGGNGGSPIPSVMISQASGQTIKAKLSPGAIVTGTLSKVGNPQPDRDGSLDNGIVAHEYGHGLSTRLTGGPSNSNCLFNEEQGGEGWSDWLSLILTIEPGDAGKDKRGIGTYALNDDTGKGIRRYPYSTDKSINPQVYGDLNLSNEVHDIGEIWSQVLWDMTWMLIDEEGFDPDWFQGTGGNNTALKLVIEGMKLQPCNPGYLDARDAILAADEMLYANKHRCLIWTAFAGRGMGALADQGSNDVAGDETEDDQLPVFCQTAIKPPVADFTVDAASNCFGRFNFTDKSTDIPQNWLWNFGDGQTSIAINPSHTYATPGVYIVTLTVTNTLGMDTHTLQVNYQTLPTPVVSGDTEICAGNTTTLQAAVAAGNTAQWLLNGKIVFTGTDFITPNLATSANYTVQQTPDFPLQKVGPKDNTLGGGGNHNTGFTGKLLFEAVKPFELISVLVFAQGEEERTIELYDSKETVIQSVTTLVPDGPSRVALNFQVPAPGLYSIGNQSQNLYRNNNGADYPYELSNLVRIYSSNATGNPANFYYYFYDWEVKEIGCTSAPAAVAVQVTPGPVAAFTATPDKLQVSFADITSGTPTSWSWNFGDGSPLVTTQNPTHTFPADGVYDVVLTVSDGNCSSAFKQTITVDDGVTGVGQAGEAFGLKIFPNPANDRLSVEISRSLGGPVTLSITDAVGRTVVAEEFAHTSKQLLLNTALLMPGVYTLRASNKEGSAVRKVTILR